MADLLQPLPPASWRDRVAAVRQHLPPWAPMAGVGVVLVVAAVALLVFRQAPPAPLILPRADVASTATGSLPPPASAGSAGAGESGPGVVTVHVAGQVVHPGVYGVPAGSRVADAVTAAGGPGPDADLDALNLAAKVADGERVYVARRGELPAAGTGGGGPATTRSGPLDLNLATADQLDVLPGVGPATAKAIVDYRTRHGRYRSVTDLLAVPGIGPAKLETLRPLVRV